MSRILRADACVVGAGAGGAVLAAELAEGGMRVVLLEQGPEHDPDGFTARPPQAKQHTGITYVPRARAAGATIITGADVRSVLVERGHARGSRRGRPRVRG